MTPTATRKFVAYYRVSTQRQGQSGLGLEAQRNTINQFVAGNGELLAEHTEVESGRRNDRPELEKALARAKRAGATLLIAKLDRLARNVAFISALMDANVDFQACDNPHANRLTLHVLAAVAEDEARRTSERTKAALLAYKTRGGKLGAAHPKCKPISREAARKGQPLATARNQQLASEAYLDVTPVIQELRTSGMSLRKIAADLNRNGYKTRDGKLWNAVQVKRILDKALQQTV